MHNDQRIDEVFYMLEQERKRAERDLQRLAAAAAYLAAVLAALKHRPLAMKVGHSPTIKVEPRRAPRRRRCDLRHR